MWKPPPQLDLVDWPCPTAALPGISGRLKATPEDFVVEEIPAYEPSGTGEHLFLWIEKLDVAAEQPARHVARGLGSRPGTSASPASKTGLLSPWQYLSVPVRCAERIPELETDRIRVLKAVQHGNKLHRTPPRQPVFAAGEGCRTKATPSGPRSRKKSPGSAFRTTTASSGSGGIVRRCSSASTC